MFTNVFTEPTELNGIIDELVATLSTAEEGSKEYSTLLDQLTKLYNLKKIDIDLQLKMYASDDEQRKTELQCELTELDIDQKKNERLILGIKPDTLALIAANLIGIGLILGHERLNVVTTKALGFVVKLKN